MRKLPQSTRFAFYQPDYVLAIVERPPGWEPATVTDIPGSAKVLESHLVASFGEAVDDLIRCNQISLSKSLDTWAVIQATDAGL